MWKKNPKAMACIKENLKHTRLERKALTISSDVMTALYRLEGEKQFDYIFMDPPYNQGLERQVLDYLAGSDLLADQGVIIVEAAKETKFDYLDGHGILYTERKDVQDKQARVHRACGEEGNMLRAIYPGSFDPGSHSAIWISSQDLRNW